MSDAFQKIQGGIDCLACPICLAKIELTNTELEHLTDTNTIRAPCRSCLTGLKTSYIAGNLYIRCE